MEGSEDKVIPGEGSSKQNGGETIIPGEKGTSSSKIIPGQENSEIKKKTQTQPILPSDTAILVAESTRQSGLKNIPPDFDNKNGSWSTITSNNPFEILYLDFKQYKIITPEIVQNNYKIILEFWADKLLIMNRGARDQMEKKYTSNVINNAERRLEAALSKLKTTASIELSYQQVDSKRLTDGFLSLAKSIKLSIPNGDITENNANLIIAEGLQNGLDVYEIESHIISVIKEIGFQPRSENLDTRHPFRNLWMTDVAWEAYQKRVNVKVEWLEEYASSVAELGDITFRKKDKSRYFLKDKNFLPPLINKLTDSASRTAEYQRIIEEETDEEKRYLKILYHLNPALPFRYRGEGYTNIAELFTDSCKTPESFWAVVDLFLKDHLQIWLSESAPEVVAMLREKKNLIGFLTFLYSINRNYPFYLNNAKFSSPEEMVSEMKTNQSLWITVALAMENGYLSTWFAGIGKADLNSKYNNDLESIIKSELYDTKELKLAAAQTLILIIDPKTPAPALQSDVSQIALMEIEGGSTAKASVKLKLSNPAFLKASVKLDTEIDGITINKSDVTFNSYNNEWEEEIVVAFDSTQLIKDKLYLFKLITYTPYETIEVPIQAKVVFPKKAYATKIAVYSILTGLYFGCFRYLLGLFIGYRGWLRGESYFIAQDSPLIFFFVFALFVTGAIYSFKLVQKFEKI